MNTRSIGLVAAVGAVAVALGVAWSRGAGSAGEWRGISPGEDAQPEGGAVAHAALRPRRDDELERAPVAGTYRGRRIFGKTVADTVAELHRRMDAGRHPYLCLTRLDHFDNAEADEALITLFADEDFEVSRHADRFAQLLRDVDDPGIGDIAMRYLKEGLQPGVVTDLAGYVKLVATKHGPNGREYAFELLTDDQYDFGSQTSSCVATLRGTRYASQLIEHARANPQRAKHYFDGLMRWREFGARMAVRSVAFDSTEDAGLRRTAIWSYGRLADRAEFTTVLSTYWNPRDELDPELALICTQAAAKSRRLRGKEATTYGLPVLEDALFGDDPKLRDRALMIFEETGEYRRDEGRKVLERFVADPTRDSGARKRAGRALKR